jgi:hypothetical protein
MQSHSPGGDKFACLAAPQHGQGCSVEEAEAEAEAEEEAEAEGVHRRKREAGVAEVEQQLQPQDHMLHGTRTMERSSVRHSNATGSAQRQPWNNCWPDMSTQPKCQQGGLLS